MPLQGLFSTYPSSPVLPHWYAPSTGFLKNWASLKSAILPLRCVANSFVIKNETTRFIYSKRILPEAIKILSSNFSMTAESKFPLLVIDIVLVKRCLCLVFWQVWRFPPPSGFSVQRTADIGHITVSFYCLFQSDQAGLTTSRYELPCLFSVPTRKVLKQSFFLSVACWAERMTNVLLFILPGNCRPFFFLKDYIVIGTQKQRLK